jgi:ABC-2 type transport system permease protein
MNSGAFRFFTIFYQLVATQLLIARQELFNKMIDLYIWIFCSLIVMGYIMQEFGLASNYGNFQLATAIGTVGLFNVYGNAARSIMDFEGECSISYYLTLPTRPFIILLSNACSYAIIGIILSIAMLPFGKLILYNSFDITAISWLRFALIITIANIFYGIFTLTVTAQVGTMSKMESIWSRFIFPLWFLGGFQFSWMAMYKLSAPLAYLLLLNPIIFIMEGSRAALLGTSDCLPWSACCAALIGFTILFWIYAHYKMKRLLDFV